MYILIIYIGVYFANKMGITKLYTYSLKIAKSCNFAYSTTLLDRCNLCSQIYKLHFLNKMMNN